MLLILINGMGYWFVCFKWDLILYLKTFQWHFRIVKMPVTSRQHGKRLMLSLSTKKRNKQILSNYRPFSLLRICGKLAEKIIFDTIFQHLKENNVLNPNQSEFFLAIPAYISLFQLPMKYMRLLMPVPHYMLEVLS